MVLAALILTASDQAMSAVMYSTVLALLASCWYFGLLITTARPSTVSVNPLQCAYRAWSLLPITVNKTRPGSSEVQMNRGSKVLGSGKIRVFRTTTPVVLSSSRRLWPFLHAGFSSASAGRAVISNANTNATLLIQEVLQRVTRPAAPGACFAVRRRWGGGVPGSLAPILLKQIARFRFSLREIRDEPGKLQKP